MAEVVRVLLVQGEARALPLADASVHCVVTSPPYYSLRDYQTGQWVGGDVGCTHVARMARNDVDEATLARRAAQYGTGTQAGSKVAPIQHTGTCPHCGAARVDQQIGQEPLHDCLAWARQEPPCAACWVCAMRVVFAEVKRVLRPEGTLWLNVGDAYAGHNLPGWRPGNEAKNGGVSNKNGVGFVAGLKPKSLIGMPWRLALALQQDGFILRSAITWCKTSPMPESVLDRPTNATEMIFLFTREPHYYYDAEAVREPYTEARGGQIIGRGVHGSSQARGNDLSNIGGYPQTNSGRNMRNYWVLGPEPTPFAHFATMPTALVRKCLLAGAPTQVCSACGKPWVRQVEREIPHDSGRGLSAKYRQNGAFRGDTTRRLGRHYQDQLNAHPSITTGFSPSCTCAAPTRPGLVLDPFCGSGTTVLVARELGLHGVGLDLSRNYLKHIARERLGLTALKAWQEGETPRHERFDDLPLFQPVEAIND